MSKKKTPEHAKIAADLLFKKLMEVGPSEIRRLYEKVHGPCPHIGWTPMASDLAHDVEVAVADMYSGKKS